MAQTRDGVAADHFMETGQVARITGIAIEHIVDSRIHGRTMAPVGEIPRQAQVVKGDGQVRSSEKKRGHVSPCFVIMLPLGAELLPSPDNYTACQRGHP
jgi:hypothetical protein